jgi:hypothetical protein
LLFRALPVNGHQISSLRLYVHFFRVVQKRLAGAAAARLRCWNTSAQ